MGCAHSLLATHTHRACNIIKPAAAAVQEGKEAAAENAMDFYFFGIEKQDFFIRIE